MNSASATKHDPDQITKSLEVLKALAADAEAWACLSEEQRIELMKICGEISRPNRDAVRLRQKQIRKRELRAIVQAERSARAQTGIRTARQATVFGQEALIQGWFDLSMLFAATTIFLAMATRATFAGFPACRMAWYSALKPLSVRAALTAAM